MAFSEEYFIHLHGTQKGPYTFPQLKGLYEKNLIPEETLYWQDGMEQWQAVSDLCGQRRRDRLSRLKQLRVAGIALVVVAALVISYFAPVLKVGWREMNQRDFTREAAYWKARGFVREEVRKQDASAGFEPLSAASVALTGTEATVTLPGTLFGKNGTAGKMTWQVRMGYDMRRREWRLPPR